MSLAALLHLVIVGDELLEIRRTVGYFARDLFINTLTMHEAGKKDCLISSSEYSTHVTSGCRQIFNLTDDAFKLIEQRTNVKKLDQYMIVIRELMKKIKHNLDKHSESFTKCFIS